MLVRQAAIGAALMSVFLSLSLASADEPSKLAKTLPEGSGIDCIYWCDSNNYWYLYGDYGFFECDFHNQHFSGDLTYLKDIELISGEVLSVYKLNTKIQVGLAEIDYFGFQKPSGGNSTLHVRYSGPLGVFWPVKCDASFICYKDRLAKAAAAASK